MVAAVAHGGTVAEGSRVDGQCVDDRVAADDVGHGPNVDQAPAAGQRRRAQPSGGHGRRFPAHRDRAWGTSLDAPGPDGFVFTNEAGKPIRRTAFSAQVWQPAARAAGLSPTETFHGLRHHYASLLIRHGESVKTVQARLGHASASETLDTYSHLWPGSEERAPACWHTASARRARRGGDRGVIRPGRSGPTPLGKGAPTVRAARSRSRRRRAAPSGAGR
ncbi:MAG: tyrosine-type recombinase/integrase [Blastococcus sp.]